MSIKLPGGKISIEILLSFQITIAGDTDKHGMFSRLCKHTLTGQLFSSLTGRPSVQTQQGDPS
jgi:hypothetical protein